jgi:hypothetical protein
MMADQKKGLRAHGKIANSPNAQVGDNEDVLGRADGSRSGGTRPNKTDAKQKKPEQSPKESQINKFTSFNRLLPLDPLNPKHTELFCYPHS